MKTLSTVAALSVVFTLALDAHAGVINVLSGDPSWTSSGNQGGGSSGIAATSLLDGDGAVAINGDRTRFGITNNVTGTGYGTLSTLSAFNFEWAVTQVGATVATAQAPALRLFTYDPALGRQIQFVWEDGEQSAPVFVNGAGSLDTTYTGSFFGAASRVYAFTSGFGRGLYDSGGSLIGGSDSAQAIANLISTLNAPGAFVFSFGVGVGSSVGDFRGFADRVSIDFGSGDATTYNFQVQGNPVPEPVSLALIALALSAAAATTARRRGRG